MLSGAVVVPRMFTGIFIEIQSLFFGPCGSKYLPCPSCRVFQKSALTSSDTEGSRLTSWHQSVFRHCVWQFKKCPDGEHTLTHGKHTQFTAKCVDIPFVYKSI